MLFTLLDIVLYLMSEAVHLEKRDAQLEQKNGTYFPKVLIT